MPAIRRFGRSRHALPSWGRGNDATMIASLKAVQRDRQGRFTRVHDSHAHLGARAHAQGTSQVGSLYASKGAYMVDISQE